MRSGTQANDLGATLDSGPELPAVSATRNVTTIPFFFAKKEGI